MAGTGKTIVGHSNAERRGSGCSAQAFPDVWFVIGGCVVVLWAHPPEVGPPRAKTFCAFPKFLQEARRTQPMKRTSVSKQKLRRDTNVPNKRQKTKKVRITLYTTGEKDYALRYLALKERKSLNRLMNDTFDSLLAENNINPTTLPDSMP